MKEIFVVEAPDGCGLILGQREYQTEPYSRFSYDISNNITPLPVDNVSSLEYLRVPGAHLDRHIPVLRSQDGDWCIDRPAA